MVLFLICVIVVLLAIMENGSDEKVMEFTDKKSLMDLRGQINRVLLDRQKIRADFRRQEMSSKKMLSNISHDIKTPLTVILGYLGLGMDRVNLSEVCREHSGREQLRLRCAYMGYHTSGNVDEALEMLGLTVYFYCERI